uniref:Uncharacterized protein n=2 Tax=Anguilla anguilla TaxID=7936 RepID=A0A0E9VHF0_ANGAN
MHNLITEYRICVSMRRECELQMKTSDNPCLQFNHNFRSVCFLQQFNMCSI